MDIHLFSTDESGLDLLPLLPPEDNVVAVIVPTNRRRLAKFERLVAASEAQGLPIYFHPAGKRLPEELPEAGAGISWLYSQIIRVEDLKKYSRGILNMHGGRIPEYRGCNVLQWAIINGESEEGITWHECVEEVDAGPIWAETVIPIPPDATGADMRKEIINAGINLFPSAWPAFRDRSGNPRYPDLTQGRVWPQRRPEDGLIGPRCSERQVRDMTRALCPPWPPATIETETGIREIEKISDEPTENSVAYTTAEGIDLNLCLRKRNSP